jgi:hypothetical protein
MVIELPARLASVLRVVYLIFNEGKAIRLARLLRSLLQERRCKAV